MTTFHVAHSHPILSPLLLLGNTAVDVNKCLAKRQLQDWCSLQEGQGFPALPRKRWGTDVYESPGAHMDRNRSWGAGLHWGKDSALPLSVISKSQCRLIRLLHRERYG